MATIKSVKLAMALNEARAALEVLQKAIREEVNDGLQSPKTNDILVNVSCNHINKAQAAIGKVGDHLSKERRERIERVN